MENTEEQIMLAVEEELPQLAKLYDDLNDYLAAGRNYPGWIKDIYPTCQDAEAGLHEGGLFVAKRDGVIVGSVILNHHPEPAYHKVKWISGCDYSRIIVIHTLAVHPNYLSQGIGKRLLDFALRFAQANNIQSIRLDVYEKNIPAIHLYEASGFTYISTVDLGLAKYGLERFRLYEKTSLLLY